MGISDFFADVVSSLGFPEAQAEAPAENTEQDNQETEPEEKSNEDASEEPEQGEEEEGEEGEEEEEEEEEVSFIFWAVRLWQQHLKYPIARS